MATKQKTKPSPQDDQPTGNLLTTQEVAEKLRVSVSSVVGWRINQKRGGPPFIKVGHHVRYDATELDKWLKAQSRQY